MAILDMGDLRRMSEVFLSEWSSPTVRDEPLIPMGIEGIYFISFWDGWLLPPELNGITPIITQNGYALDPDTGYTIETAGDMVRGKIKLVNAAGPDAILLATFRRAVFRNSFWQSNLYQSIGEVNQRLMLGSNVNQDLSLDDSKDPWHIIIKMAGKNALVNLQTMLGGFGKTVLGSVTVDLSRAYQSIPDTIAALKADIDIDVTAWRWSKSPLPRQAVTPLRGPWTDGVWMTGRLY